MKSKLLIVFLALMVFVPMMHADSIESNDYHFMNEIYTHFKKNNIQLAYDFHMLSFFDNREYKSQYQKAQTLYGIRVSPELGFQIKEGSIASHKVMMGGHYLKWMGGESEENIWMMSLYYQYKTKNVLLNVGSVPYYNIPHDIPDYLISDSLLYVSPNVRGLLFQYKNQKISSIFLCDWRGRQSHTKREAFRLVGLFEYKRKMIYMGAYLQMNHVANYLPPTPRIGVIDDILINPFIRFDLSKMVGLDECALEYGYLHQFNRERISNHVYRVDASFFLLKMRYKYLSLTNQLYIGDDLFPLYKSYGVTLVRSNPFYQYNLYDKVKMQVILLHREYLNCVFSWNLHISPEDVGHQQQLILNFRLP